MKNLKCCVLGDGFTLIEVLVSIVVLSMSLSVLMGVFSAGLRSKRMAQEYTIAVAQADNILSDVLLKSKSIEPGNITGVFEDGSHWVADISLWENQDTIAGNRGDDKGLFRIEITVTWTTGDREKNYTLQTIVQK